MTHYSSFSNSLEQLIELKKIHLPIYYIQLRNSEMKEMHRTRHGGRRMPRASVPSPGTQPSQYISVLTSLEAF